MLLGRENSFVCYLLLVIVWFLYGEVSLRVGACYGLHDFIVALPGLPYNYFTCAILKLRPLSSLCRPLHDVVT